MQAQSFAAPSTTRSRPNPSTTAPPRAHRSIAEISPWVHAVLNEEDEDVKQGISLSVPREATLGALDALRSARVSPDVLDHRTDVASIVGLVRDSPALFPKPSDQCTAIAALHVMASDKECREAIIAANAVESITLLIIESSQFPAEQQRSLSRTESAGPPPPLPLETSLPPLLWNTAIRALAKLIVCSSAACSRAFGCDAIAVLASAALPMEQVDTRVRAAAALAAIATWSGPRHAVEVLETRNVVTSMASVLTASDSRIPNHLKRATLDGLSVMAHRRGARLILRQSGCVQFMSEAARNASISGDHDIAARSTVAAGHMSGHSLDEFGFLVENPEDPNGPSSVESSAVNSGRSVGDAPKRRRTGLAQIKAELLQEEAFMASDVNGSGRMDGSSPHRGAFAGRVSAGNPSGQSGVVNVQHRLPSDRQPAGGVSIGSDPHHTSGGRETGDNPAGALGHGGSPVSPLVHFSSATERAALRDSTNGFQRTESQQQLQAERERVWESVLYDRPEGLERENGDFGRISAYQELIGVPVPTKLRAEVWPRLLDVEGLRKRKPGLYEALCTHAETATLDEDIEHTIEADLTRTMPFHCLFWQKGAAPGIDPLRRVLRAYAFHVPAVGYCQGMSSIAALILVNSSSEEDAFLMLVRFMSRYGYKNVFKPGFPQYKIWLEEVRAVLAARYPRLNAHFEKEGVIPELFLDKAIITCLTHHYPHRALVRIWDLMLLGGSPKIILKACLAVLVMSEKALLGMSFETIVTYLQRGFADPENGILQDDAVEDFVDVARSVKLSKEPLPGAEVAVAAGAEVPVARPQVDQTPKKGGCLSACFPCFGPKDKED